MSVTHPEAPMPGFDTDARLWLWQEPLRTPRRTPVLLVPPLLHEYERCHRALRRLALLLAQAGFASCRFDWRGHGDSGEVDDAQPLDAWCADCAALRARCVERAGVAPLLVGLRHGANIAQMVAGDDAGIAWHGIADPTACVATWRRTSDAQHRRLGRAPATDCVWGYPLDAATADALAALPPVHARPPWERDDSGDDAALWQDETVTAAVPAASLTRLVARCAERCG